MAILGRLTFKVNGKKLKTMRGASLDPGGLIKSPVVTSTEVAGFSGETAAPMLTVKIVQTSDVGLTFVQGIDGATGLWAGDDGKNYVLDGLTTVGKTTLDEVNGIISATMSATSCTEA